MIIGHGVDLIDIRRIDRTIDRFGERFIKRILSIFSVDVTGKNIKQISWKELF